MSTRHTSDPETFAQERYMSALQFVELRPLSGNLVAEKAQLYTSKQHREMLFFLHAVSIEPGGLKELARRMVAEFPQNVCSPTMEALGANLDASANEEQVSARVQSELSGDTREGNRELAQLELEVCCAEILATGGGESDPLRDALKQGGAAAMRARCAWLASKNLPKFLAELCLDPSLDLHSIEATGRSSSAAYIGNLWAMLCHYKAEAESSAKIPEVKTSIGRLVHSTLSYAFTAGRMVVVEGLAGSGKTHAAQHWCRMHPGRARIVSLAGIMHRTSLFQEIARAIGIATSGRKAGELQTRIEDFFQTSKLMLVIDEAHYLWPQTKRCTSAPELINWVLTALVNRGVPVALICTDQFIRLKANVEKQTGWTSEQLMHRVKRYTKLPADPLPDDITAIAELYLGMEWSEAGQAWCAGTLPADEAAVDEVVVYGLCSRLPIAATRDLIDEARVCALAEGRARVTQADVLEAKRTHQLPSDLAMKSAFPVAPVPRCKRERPARPNGAPGNLRSDGGPLSTGTPGAGRLQVCDSSQTLPAT